MPLANEYEIICIDECHFRRDADKRRCWSPVGETPKVYVNGSTQNANVYGAYTLHKIFHYKFVKKQLAVKTIAFFERLRKIYKKIILLVDKAKWHTAKSVQKFVDENSQDVKIFFFPTASPDLNPVEECWRETRNEVTANKAHGNLEVLKYKLRQHWNRQKFKHEIINYLCP